MDNKERKEKFKELMSSLDFAESEWARCRSARIEAERDQANAATRLCKAKIDIEKLFNQDLTDAGWK